MEGLGCRYQHGPHGPNVGAHTQTMCRGARHARKSHRHRNRSMQKKRGFPGFGYQHGPHGRSGGVLGILDNLGLDPRHGSLNDIPPLPRDCKEALNARQDHHLVSHFGFSLV
jgi:hypothetical protein